MLTFAIPRFLLQIYRLLYYILTYLAMGEHQKIKKIINKMSKYAQMELVAFPFDTPMWLCKTRRRTPPDRRLAETTVAHGGKQTAKAALLDERSG